MHAYEMLQRSKRRPGALAPPGMNEKCTVVMASAYLERSLRTLETAIEDRASRRAPAPAARYANSHESGPDSIELLVRLLTETTNRDGAIEAPAPALAPAPAPGAAGPRSPLDRNRAA